MGENNDQQHIIWKEETNYKSDRLVEVYAIDEEASNSKGAFGSCQCVGQCSPACSNT